ncbi:MAG: carbohydrate kinase family protein [Candidatus Heimdallarchaeota archaeon]|nr:carbohydrate kinase family protein [Candidatus Heimdallarchaeota archaeon]
MTNRRIFCLGHISIDVFIHRKDLNDLKIGGCISSPNLSIQSGGTEANVSFWLGKLGVNVSMIGVIADDPLGHFLQKDLERANVKCYLKKSIVNPSSSILIVVEETGERSFIINGKCLNELELVDVPIKEIQGGNLFYTSAYNIENLPIRNTVKEIIKISKENEEQAFEVAFNLAAYTTVERNNNLLKQDVLPYVDILIGNYKEYKSLLNTYKSQPLPQDLLEKALNKFPNIKILLLTDSEDGCYFRTLEDRGHIPANQVTVIDTTGAGDGFCAGFISKYVMNSSIKQAVNEGNKLGTYICQGFGAHYNSEDYIRKKAKSGLE